MTCPALSAPTNGMIECSPGVSTPSPEPTPAPVPILQLNKRFLTYFYNYNYDSGDDSSIGDVCTFSCDDGFVTSGSDTRTCEEDGDWSGTHTTCESIY